MLLCLCCNQVKAQSIPADSVRMIVLPESGEIGFVIPRTAAVHYRNLVFNMVPALEEKIKLLEASSSQQLNLSTNQLQQIDALERQRRNLQQQIDTYATDTAALSKQLDEVNMARKREIRRKKFWRSSNYLFMGTTGLLAVLLIAK